MPVNYSDIGLSDLVGDDPVIDGSEFNSEFDLCNWFEKYIGSYIKIMYGLEYFEHIREYRIYGENAMPKRLDFVVKTKCGKKIGLEFKHPDNVHNDLCFGIGQVLGYKVLCGFQGESIDMWGLVTSKISLSAPLIIISNKIELDLFVISKTKLVRCGYSNVRPGKDN